MNDITNTLIEKEIDNSIFRPKDRAIMKDRMLRGKTFDEILDEYFGELSPRARKKERAKIYKTQEWIKHLISVKYVERKETE